MTNKVIFLDAVGTLFGIRGTVGELYARQARQFDVEVSDGSLDKAFIESFRASPTAAFPGVDPADIPSYEFNWWKAIATQTFERAGVFHQFSDFDKFFSELYAYFATDEPWFVYPDVIVALEYWQQQQVQLGVVSNFDSRLYSVLKILGLGEFFTSITLSTEVGAAKPNPQIFAAALEKHNCLASDALHVGDSFKEDYEGAKSAGLNAIWLQRGDRLPESVDNFNENSWTQLYPKMIQ